MKKRVKVLVSSESDENEKEPVLKKKKTMKRKEIRTSSKKDERLQKVEYKPRMTERQQLKLLNVKLDDETSSEEESSSEEEIIPKKRRKSPPKPKPKPQKSQKPINKKSIKKGTIDKDLVKIPRAIKHPGKSSNPQEKKCKTLKICHHHEELSVKIIYKNQELTKVLDSLQQEELNINRVISYSRFEMIKKSDLDILEIEVYGEKNEKKMKSIYNFLERDNLVGFSNPFGFLFFFIPSRDACKFDDISDRNKFFGAIFHLSEEDRKLAEDPKPLEIKSTIEKQVKLNSVLEDQTNSKDNQSTKPIETFQPSSFPSNINANFLPMFMQQFQQQDSNLQQLTMMQQYVQYMNTMMSNPMFLQMQYLNQQNVSIEKMNEMMNMVQNNQQPINQIQQQIQFQQPNFSTSSPYFQCSSLQMSQQPLPPPKESYYQNLSHLDQTKERDQIKNAEKEKVAKLLENAKTKILEKKPKIELLKHLQTKIPQQTTPYITRINSSDSPIKNKDLMSDDDYSSEDSFEFRRRRMLEDNRDSISSRSSSIERSDVDDSYTRSSSMDRSRSTSYFSRKRSYSRSRSPVHRNHRLIDKRSRSNSPSSYPQNEQRNLKYCRDPTRYLYLRNLENSTCNQQNIFSDFRPFGKIESICVLINSKCAFVDYFNVEDAVNAKSNLERTQCYPEISFQFKD
eukprot:gene3840-7000_t